MKKIFSLLFALTCAVTLLICVVPTQAQTVIVTHSLAPVEASSAVAMYNNQFGYLNNPELDDPFPFAVIRMDLVGDVREAKMRLGLYLGTMIAVEAINKDIENTILFAVPRSAKNIYLTCGDGCEKQLLYQGTLQSNKVYSCRVEYQKEEIASTTQGGNDAQMLQKLQELTEKLEKMEQGQTTPQSSTPQAGTKVKVVKGDGYETYSIDDVSFDMVFVEGGTFMMGATEEQGKEATKYEKPSHSVTLSDFYIGKYEVTQALWKKIMKTTVRQLRDEKANPTWAIVGEGPRFPMYYISWNECQEFIDKLNFLFADQLGGKRFAFPTEAQWEFAARGGNKSAGYKYAGSNNVSDVAWCSNNSKGMTHAVGTKASNELGLYDMSGNVFEWCQDGYEAYSDKAQTNPMFDGSGMSHMLRGGCWRHNTKYSRVSYRSSYSSNNAFNYHIGFRLALVP